MNLFNELKTSLEEAVGIKNGTQKPVRVTRYERADVKGVKEKIEHIKRKIQPTEI